MYQAAKSAMLFPGWSPSTGSTMSDQESTSWYLGGTSSKDGQIPKRTFLLPVKAGVVSRRIRHNIYLVILRGRSDKARRLPVNLETGPERYRGLFQESSHLALDYYFQAFMVELQGHQPSWSNVKRIGLVSGMTSVCRCFTVNPIHFYLSDNLSDICVYSCGGYILVIDPVHRKFPDIPYDTTVFAGSLTRHTRW